MPALNFYAMSGKVYVEAGARSAYVTQEQADAYAALFFEHRLVSHANRLSDAMMGAGYVPWGRLSEVFAKTRAA